MRPTRYPIIILVLMLVLALFSCRGDVVGSASFERPTEEVLDKSDQNTIELNSMVFKASGNDYENTGLDYVTEAHEMENGAVLYSAKPVFASDENTSAFEGFVSEHIKKLEGEKKNIRMDFRLERVLDFVRIYVDLEVFGDEGWSLAETADTYWWPEKSSFVTFPSLIEYDRYKTFLGDFLKEKLVGADPAKIDAFLEAPLCDITSIADDGVTIDLGVDSTGLETESSVIVPWEYLDGRIVDIIERAWAQYNPYKGEGEKVVAITFDDGPSYSNTMQILDVLEKHQAKATFFCAGHRIANMSATKAQTVLNRVLYLGSQLGNHSYSHANFNLLEWEGIESELTKTQDWVFKYTGTNPTVMRPPYGNFKKELVGNTELFCILWNRDILDWKDRDTAIVTQRVLDQAKNGDIILLHDIHKTTADAVEAIVVGLQEKGFRLVTIEELFDLRNQEKNDLKYFAYNYTR
ncbi:MAG: hypothetical protein E7646_06535 [Ruminococcaceae bacterium]|nr:hypothetical protein [Oscillospiraceae bacterium]